MSVIKKKIRSRRAPDDRRLEIKEAALKVFADKGYQASSVQDIVSKANVAQGTFYLYFRSKKAAFLELMSDFAEKIMASFDVLEAKEISPADIELEKITALLKAGYRRYFDACRENIKLTKMFFQESLFGDEEFRLKRKEIYSGLARRAKLFLDRGIRLGAIRPMKTEVAAYCIVGMVERVTTELFLPGREPQVEKLIDELASYESQGIVNPNLKRSE